MNCMRPLNSLFIVLCVLSLALVVCPTITTSAESNGLQAAWERAREAGAYDFTADVEQTLIPRPLPSMIGQTDERVDMRIEGEVALPDYTRLQLRFEGGGLDMPALELIQDGAETFLLKDGEKIPVENPAALSSPTADYLGYLAAAENVRISDQSPVNSDQSPADDTQHAIRNTHYVYDINGPRFADYVRDQMEAQLREGATVGGQPLPPGVSLSPSPLLQRMTGRGELWVDANGLPRRQVVDLEIPGITEQYDAQVHMIVDFDFGKSTSQQVNKSANRRDDREQHSPHCPQRCPVSDGRSCFGSRSHQLRSPPLGLRSRRRQRQHYHGGHTAAPGGRHRSFPGPPGRSRRVHPNHRRSPGCQ